MAVSSNVNKKNCSIKNVFFFKLNLKSYRQDDLPFSLTLTSTILSTYNNEKQFICP